jgi:hypothetical protein
VIALDTNLLVYAHRAGAAEHRAARSAIERAARDPRGWGFTLLNLVELWSVATHPAAAAGPSLPGQVRGFVEALLGAGARLWLPREAFGSRLLRLAEQLDVVGPRVFDLEIALTAFDHGASELWSHDRGFRSVPGLAVLDPLA